MGKRQENQKKSKREKKKVVLFLVEGKSDVSALEYAVPQFYEEIDPLYEVYFPTIQDENQSGGDITSKNGISPQTIENCIYKLFLDKFLKNRGLYPKDITEIVQIVDIDGVYIPDECVAQKKEDPAEDNILYKDDHIEAVNVKSIITRNAEKRENLNYLMGLKKIKVKSKTVKYFIYYFSCNLDHFLHGDANMKSRQKCLEAEKFSMKCINDMTVFTNTFTNNDAVTASMAYEESWEYIKQGLHSLERHSNLNLLIERLMASRG